MKDRPYLIIPMKAISRLTELNGTYLSKEKAKEEASEFLVELCSNKDDQKLSQLFVSKTLRKSLCT